MEKTTYVLEKNKAIKGHTKAKNNRLKFYKDNSSRIEEFSWECIQNFDFEKEVKSLSKIFNEKRSYIYIK
jgi:hypothetical protein